jgi:hypothetical protein
MAKKAPATQELFQEEVNKIEIKYPVVIKYNDGGMEAYQENGVQLFIKVSGDKIAFLKRKWGDPHQGNSKQEYEYFIKRLLYTHTLSDEEQFNLLYDKFNSVNELLDTTVFEHEFEQIETEQNISALIKKKNEQPGQEENHPF